MKWFRHWKIVTSLAAIFILGMVTGGLFTLSQVRKKFELHNQPDKFCAKIMKGAVSSLKLTPQQAEQIQPIVREGALAVQKQQWEHLQALHRLACDMEDKSSGVLTPEQKVLVQKGREKRFRKIEKWLKSGENSPVK